MDGALRISHYCPSSMRFPQSLCLCVVNCPICKSLNQEVFPTQDLSPQWLFKGLTLWGHILCWTFSICSYGSTFHSSLGPRRLASEASLRQAPCPLPSGQSSCERQHRELRKWERKTAFTLVVTSVLDQWLEVASLSFLLPSFFFLSPSLHFLPSFFVHLLIRSFIPSFLPSFSLFPCISLFINFICKS